MQGIGATFISHYRRFLCIAGLVAMLMLTGSSAVFAQDSTTPEATTGEQTVVPEQASGLPGPGPGEGCDDPTEITTFSGTDNRRTDVFGVTSDVLRVRYFTEVTDPDSIDDNLVVTVFRANGDRVDSVLILDPGSGSQNVLLPGPGNYYLEIEAGDVRYELAIDACGEDIGPTTTGTTTAGSTTDTTTAGTSGTPTTGTTTDAATTAGDTTSTTKDAAKVINDTISKKPLPNTGGIAILAPIVGLLLISGAVAGQLVRRR